MFNPLKKTGITTRVSTHGSQIEKRDAIAHDWTSLLRDVLPNNNWITIPNFGSREVIEYCIYCDIEQLIFTGGDYIVKDQIRYRTELLILDWSEKAQIPLIGVCRGMQIMSHWAGVKLKSIDGHKATRHPVVGSYTGVVNSFHNFALADVPSHFSCEARSPDGEIEAIKSKDGRMIGIMWHPEREEIFDERDLHIFGHMKED